MIWWERGNDMVGRGNGIVGGQAVFPAIKGKGAGNSAGHNFFGAKCRKSVTINL